MIFSDKDLPALKGKPFMERWRLMRQAAVSELTYIWTFVLAGLICLVGGFLCRSIFSTGTWALDLLIPTWILLFVLGYIHALIMLNTVFLRRFGTEMQSAKDRDEEED